MDAGRQLWVEAHVLDFEGDLYGKPLQIRFLEKIRDEKRFASLGELAEQIRKDCEAVRAAGASTSGKGGAAAGGAAPKRRRNKRAGPS